MCPICVYIRKNEAAQSDGLEKNMWLFSVSNCNCHCVSGGCSGFHVASVPNSDLGSLSAAVRAAPSHLGAHTGRQTKVSKAHRKSWFSLLWWNWPTVNVSWCCVCVHHLYLCVFICACPQGWLPNRKASEHEEGDPLYRQSVPQRQDLAKADEAQQERVPDLPGCGRLIQHGGQPL